MSPSYGSSAPSSSPRWPGPISAASTSSPPRKASFSRRDRSRSSSRLETGKVEAIHVGNGALVQAGDVLVELDRSAALADAEGARAELASARAEILRRKTALLSARSRRFDPPPAIDWPDSVAPALRERETRVLAADLGQLAANVASFDAERAQKTAEGEKLRRDHRDAEEPRRDPAGARRHAHEARRSEGGRAGRGHRRHRNAAISDHAGGEAGAGSGFPHRGARGHRPQFRQGGRGLRLRKRAETGGRRAARGRCRAAPRQG